MKPTFWLRCTAALMVIFAIGHTAGFLTFRPRSAEGMAVWNSMNTVTFTQGHAVYTYGGFYIGFGLFNTLFQIFLAWLAWWLGSATAKRLPVQSVIAAMCLVQTIGFVLSLRYFSALPAAFSLLAAVCLAFAFAGARKLSDATNHAIKQ